MAIEDKGVGPFLVYQSLRLNPENGVLWRDLEAIQLSPVQIRLMQVLITPPETIVSSDKLWAHITDMTDQPIDDRTQKILISELMRHLRSVVEPDMTRATYIQRIRGAGYELRVK